MIRGIAVSFLILLSTSSWANEPWLNYFQIDPKVCVVEKNTECQRVFRIHWQLKKATSVCLYQQGTTAALLCHSNRHNGEYTVALTLEQDMSFTLVATQLAQESNVSVSLLTLGADVRRSKRRFWSVF